MLFFFSSRRRHTRCGRDWSSDVCSSDLIIDTPGVKAFGVVDLDKKVMSHYFPEMRALLNECKFHNCQHLNEPDCAIKEAVEYGEIHPSRYNTYLDLITEDQTQNYR